MDDQPRSPAEIWQTAYGELELQLPPETFNTWLRGARLVAHEGGTFIIGVPNIYAREWLEQRLKKAVIRTLERLARRGVEVRFVLVPEHASDAPAQDVHTAGPLLAPLEKPAQASPRFERLAPGETGLNPRQTFEMYAVGAPNRLAHAAALAVAELPAAQFNPLYICGGVGLGKSHLLHAIGHACVTVGHRVLYAAAETFTNDLVAAIRANNTTEFRAKYRDLDVLLIDDIQFLAGKDTTQEEFFHTFEALFNAGAQVVLAASRPPGEIRRLDGRLRSRFEGGLVVEIQPPDYLTRLDILEIKTGLQGYGDRLSLDVLERIAEKADGSVRELEGALNRVIATLLVTGHALTLSEAEEILEQTEKVTGQPVISLEDILVATATYFGVTAEDICGRGRSREVSTARQVVMYLAREVADIPLQQIGEVLGGRNHSTVLYSCERIGALMHTDSLLRRQVQAILRTVQPQSVPQERRDATG
jgi:chromosomal replication initiator protein